MEERKGLRESFLKKSNLDYTNIEELKQDASCRKYFRIHTKSKTFLLVDIFAHRNVMDDFVKISNMLAKHNYSVPEIFSKDETNNLLIIEDFGDNSFTQILKKNPEKEPELYNKAIDVLIDLHKNNNNLDSLKEYDEHMLMEESLIFLDWFILILNDKKVHNTMKDDFIAILKGLLKVIDIFPKVMVLRDYHADNLLWLDDRDDLKKIGIIDFQDAVLGCPIYDIMALIEDARRDVSDDVALGSVNRYLRAFPKYKRKDFIACYKILGVQRNLKIIGIFTKLAIQQKKTSYLSMLPRVWRYIYHDIQHPLLLPLKKWLSKAIPEHMDRLSSNNSHYVI